MAEASSSRCLFSIIPWKTKRAMTDLIVIKRYEQAHLAHLDCAKLGDEGIECVLKDENTISVIPVWSNAMGGIKLLIHKSDLQKVTLVFGANEYSDLQNAFDGQIESQLICPNCGSAEVQQKRSILTGLIFLIFFFVPLATTTKKYLCTSCTHIWK
jgi:hypothetical protein